MTRRLRLAWPDERPFERLGRSTIRILALSDEADPTLEDARNRAGLGPIDLVVGCGDLKPDRLAFAADSLHAPLAFVRGNHDAGEGWEARAAVLPTPLRAGIPTRECGLLLVGLPWPGRTAIVARRDELTGWQQSVRVVWRRLAARPEPIIVVSHAPPLGAGDVATDPYHLGFRAYRWLLERLRPPLWLHGHTPLAAGPWRVECGPTTVVNVTGSVLVELERAQRG